MPQRNTSLHTANKVKNDEFYTQLPDIENELKHYQHHFEGKTVFCNCDDPYESNFFKYFAMNFNFLKLKKLIVTGYSTSAIAYRELGGLFDVDKPKAYKIELNEMYDVNKDGCEDLLDVRYFLEKMKESKNTLTALQGDGDFRSEESVKLLKEADIVVTNPPFSIAREFYIPQLFENEKKFLIVGDLNRITYKSVFPLLQNNKMWLGYNHLKAFIQPNGELKKFGNKLRYTNLDIKKRHEELILYKKYNQEDYPMYDNYNVIEVSKIVNIPIDYDGIMGVPITFLEKYNPEQFEILGLTQRGCHDLVPDIKKYDDFWEMTPDGEATGSFGGKTNENANLRQNDGKKNYFINKEGYIVQSAYQRVFIRRKK